MTAKETVTAFNYKIATKYTQQFCPKNEIPSLFLIGRLWNFKVLLRFCLFAEKLDQFGFSVKKGKAISLKVRWLYSCVILEMRIQILRIPA